VAKTWRCACYQRPTQGFSESFMVMSSLFAASCRGQDIHRSTRQETQVNNLVDWRSRRRKGDRCGLLEVEPV